jgi:hypothetical protein
MKLNEVIGKLLDHLYEEDVKVEILKRDKYDSVIERKFVPLRYVRNKDLGGHNFHRITIEQSDIDEAFWEK